ncbi:cell shape determination protein CcmA [Sphingopyxis terrae subsp. terrae NBRC 15098]|jgi:cytoskeletal protein CcmA (bactofilin family)|uniref:Cell shape determination protein CcmA n=2 Tax=Sphingopyxis terrae TaxID=33052 RepID=A0A142VY31_9SPHN|nr:cell shape determination protein CcmA [Sphingopyxis terrae subsp. terrae NBRC 15098]
MFSKSKTTPDSGSAPSLPPVPAKMATGARHTTFSIIGSDVVITGNVSASVDLHVDGKIEGDLKCANLVQGEASEIKGGVVAETAKLAGLVDGSIEAKTLIIHASARITGDVTYETITIENGGKVDGKLSHRRAGAAKAPPALEVVGEKPASFGA